MGKQGKERAYASEEAVWYKMHHHSEVTLPLGDQIVTDMPFSEDDIEEKDEERRKDQTKTCEEVSELNMDAKASKRPCITIISITSPFSRAKPNTTKRKGFKTITIQTINYMVA